MKSCVAKLNDKQLVTDAVSRGLLHRDLTTLDSHPAAVAERKVWTRVVFEAGVKNAKDADFIFIGKKIMETRTLRRFTRDAHPQTYCRTPSGLTTRVSGPGYVMEQAKAHDRSQGKEPEPSKGKEPEQEAPQLKVAGGTQRAKKDAKKDAQRANQNKGKQPTTTPLATSTSEPAGDTHGRHNRSHNAHSRRQNPSQA